MRLKPFLSMSCLLLAVLILAGMVGTGGESRAQGAYTDDRFPHLFAPRDQRPRIISIPQRTRPAARAPAAAEPVRPTRREPPAATSATADAEVPRPPPTTFVLVLGDNLAEWLAHGIEEAFEDVPELGVKDRTRLGSGLARPDTYDWPAEIRRILSEDRQVSFIVMMVGAHDRHPIRNGEEVAEFGSDRWRELYGQRVEAAMQAMKARGVPVYWVGSPPLRGQRISADMVRLNEIYKERAQKLSIPFIDVWNGFVDERGNYTQFGPDFAGQTRRLRTSDGVHFTAPGARKLALFLEQELRRDLVGRIEPASPADPAPGLPVPEAAVPGLLPQGIAPVAPRPLAGPVLPLAGNPSIPRPEDRAVPDGAQAPPPGRLAGDSAAPVRSGLAETVLVRGAPPPVVPGRADDFRWPRASATATPAGSTGETARNPP
ncbi:SGNH/GDSL hydrolase family protein [Phreatobacter sp.]|uniref:SGNH/GDSL hydrolase family protein n=1 Tax=Phreatobacter sp. TaxID=1966341 RepID=UPI003F718754